MIKQNWLKVEIYLLRFVLPLILLCSWYSAPCYSQHNTQFIDQFFKDNLFNPQIVKGFQGTGLLPYIESEIDLTHTIRDSSKQYYTLTDILLKKHLFEIKGADFSLNISPIADLRVGKDLSDTSQRRLFQNTRGIYIEGDLLKQFSFSTSIYENQGRFAAYQSSFFQSVGELYTQQASGTYSQQNAVIPGAARTKPFKIDGFDYAYATGNIIYRPNKAIHFIAGNTSHFIGDGYRSLLLSDNSVPAPFLRTVLKATDKIEINCIRMRLFNLIRRPVSSSVESYYESKAYSVNYISYKPFKGLVVSLFEGVIWSRGDSIVSKRVHPLFYSPVPGSALPLLSRNELNYLLGINAGYTFFEKYHAYGQLASSNGHFNNPAFQLGIRAYSLAGQRDLMVQAEFNHVPKGTYNNGNPSLSYSHYNLPLATIQGEAFDEFILRITYEWNRLYVSEKLVIFNLKEFDATNWLPIYTSPDKVNGKITHNALEVGYRFNRKMNLCLFGSWIFRKDNLSNNPASLIHVGLRTGILNHYNDF
jgi:hypothetical protein